MEKATAESLKISSRLLHAASLHPFFLCSLALNNFSRFCRSYKAFLYYPFSACLVNAFTIDSLRLTFASNSNDLGLSLFLLLRSILKRYISLTFMA